MKEIPIGGRFELRKLIYEVREATSCEHCACYIKSENECTNNGDFPPCSSHLRNDSQDVAFIQVGEAVD